MTTLKMPRLRSWLPSAAGRERLLASRWEPILHADWLDAVFLHYSVDPEFLQPWVPYPLDLHEGRAYVSLVAFTMQDMRPRHGGKLGALLMKPISTHEFLNVRTYVKHDGEKGIYFLAEWLPNALSTALGPSVFGLPYRHGRLEYQNDHLEGRVQGFIRDTRSGTFLNYHAETPHHAEHRPCFAGSLDEFLLERYTAFTQIGPFRRSFHVWHPPWAVIPIQAQVKDAGLLAETGDWAEQAVFHSAHHSPGYPGVWMGRPHWEGRGLRSL